MSCSISPDFSDERYMVLFASVLQHNKSMLSHWKDFRRFHRNLTLRNSKDNLSARPLAHTKKSLHTNRKKRGNPDISLQYCFLLHVGCWARAVMPKFPQAPSQEVMHSQWEHIPCAKEAVDKASRGWEGLTGSNRSRNKNRVCLLTA